VGVSDCCLFEGSYCSCLRGLSCRIMKLTTSPFFDSASSLRVVRLHVALSNISREELMSTSRIVDY
jgi:hypothetical protein